MHAVIPYFAHYVMGQLYHNVLLPFQQLPSSIITNLPSVTLRPLPLCLHHKQKLPTLKLSANVSYLEPNTALWNSQQTSIFRADITCNDHQHHPSSWIPIVMVLYITLDNTDPWVSGFCSQIIWDKMKLRQCDKKKYKDMCETHCLQSTVAGDNKNRRKRL